LLRYLGLLERWNGVYNLTAVRHPQVMLSHHVLDCLAALAPLQRHCPDGGAQHRLIDVGSGAGLPGVVLGIMDPELRVLCVDSVGKKAAFIQQAIAEIGLPNVRSEHARVEAVRETAGVVTARAYASLAKFVSTTAHLLDGGGVWMAMKAKRPTEELAALGPETEVFHVEPLVVPTLSEERCLVWMRPAPHS
jgi:16S rRNA (guanine527-N7)-methyltransferase